MAISVEVQETSYQALIKTYGKRLNAEQHVVLKEINKIAAEEDIVLSPQSSKLLSEIITEIKKANKDAQAIYDDFRKKYDNLSLENRKIHEKRSGYSSLPIHTRPDRDQLQDHDMTQLMPKSTETIAVLAPVDTAQIQTLEAIQIGLRNALEDKSIQHIIFPIGPRHWRGFYLTKPSAESATYELELFDSFGPDSAKNIENFVFSRLLEPLAIKKEQVKISFKGPKFRQRDMYSCGDFVCTYSHKKMKDFGAAESDYNPKLIEVIETSNQLRLTTQEEIKKLTPIESNASSSKSSDSFDPPVSPDSYVEIFSTFFNAKPPITPIKKPKPPSKDRGWIALLGVTGSALLCALIGAIIGASLFPGIGVLFGALIGIAVGVLAGLAIMGVSRLLSKSTKEQHTGITREDLKEINTNPRPHSKSLKDTLETSKSCRSNAVEPKPNLLTFRKLVKGPTIEQPPAIPEVPPQADSSPQFPANP